MLEELCYFWIFLSLLSYL